MQLHPELAERAIATASPAPLGHDGGRGGRGILRIANAT